MKILKVILSVVAVVALALVAAFFYLRPPQITIDGVQYSALAYEVEVNGTIDDVWKVLADDFTTIADVIDGISASGSVDDNPTAGLGAVRFCNITVGGTAITIKEKIIDWQVSDNHREFTYDVYEFSENRTPLRGLLNAWGVREDNGKVVLYVKTYYKMTYSVLEVVGRGQVGQGTKNAALGFKHFIETGEKKVNKEILREKYKDLL